MASPYNPIKFVGGASVPCPSYYQWSLEDVSAADAGRTEDALMHKKMIAQKIRLDLRWDGLSDEEASSVLKAFNPEYVMVEYKDALSGTFEVKEFYTGNRSAPLYNTNTGVWENITFAIIQR